MLITAASACVPRYRSSWRWSSQLGMLHHWAPRICSMRSNKAWVPPRARWCWRKQCNITPVEDLQCIALFSMPPPGPLINFNTLFLEVCSYQAAQPCLSPKRAHHLAGRNASFSVCRPAYHSFCLLTDQSIPVNRLSHLSFCFFSSLTTATRMT